jgi:hypothetical protein
LFAVSEAEVNGKPVLVLVDPSDPANIVITATSVTSLVGEMAVAGNRLYTSSAQGLTIYDIGSVVAIPVTASVVVPTTGATQVAGSFNTAPDQIVHGTNMDTYVWHTTLSFGFANPTFTWQSLLNNLTTGDVQPVTLGATVNFTSQGTSGTLQLPGTTVTGVSIISILPPSQTVIPGGIASYDIRLTNPSSAAVTYDVFQPFNSFANMTINNGNSNITVAAGATIDVPLLVSASTFASPGIQHFMVEAGSVTSPAVETASADLVVMSPPFASPNPNAYGVAATLTPTQATAGQGASAQYTVQITNTGSEVGTFFYVVNGLPSGIVATLNRFGVDVPPGVSNFRDQPLTLTAQPGTAPGTYPFTVAIQGPASTTINGTLTVVASGVSVSLNPGSGSPGDTFSMLVTNTGTVADTYNLALAGPVSTVANLVGSTTVTLNPGQSATVPIAVGAINFADAGNLTLMAVATSQTDANVLASAAASVTIPTTKGMTGQFNPATETLRQIGPATFLLEVNNTGNLEDAYTATITGSTGPLQASLTGLDGLPTQTVPFFRLPGLSTGVLVLQVNLTALQQGTVTVQVQSLSDPTIAMTATATVDIGAPLPVPTLTVTGGTFPYNALPEPATGSVTGTDEENLGTPTFTYTDSHNVTSSNPPINVGTYTVTATFVGNTSYTPTTKTATIVITLATPTLSVMDNGGTYTSNAFPASATATGVGSDGTLASSPNSGLTFTYYVGSSISVP